MSISSRISSMEEHVTNAYNGLQGLGADLTNVNKNIENISMVLDDIYDSLPSVSGEGTSLTLNDTRVGKIKSTLKGNTSQDGTPTPTSPIPVNVVSGDNEINVCGKNLANTYSITQIIHNGVTFTPVYENGLLQYINANGTATATAYIDIARKVYKAGNYILNGSPANGSINSYRQLMVTFPSFIAIGTDDGNGATVTLDGTTEYFIRCRIASGYTANNIKFYPMLRYSTITDDTYEPYIGNSYPLYLGVENLLNLPNVSTTSNGITSTITNGKLKIVGTTTTNWFSICNLNIPLESGTYTFSYTNKKVNRYNLNIKYADNTTQVIYGNAYSNTPITLNQKATITAMFSDNNTTGATFDYEDYLMIEKGSKANSYTPYGTTPIELCKIGNYKDYFYKGTGKNLLSIVPPTSSSMKKGITSTYDSATGEISFSGTTTESYPWLSDATLDNPIQIGTNLIFSTKETKSYQIIARLYDSNGGMDAVIISPNATSNTITTTREVTRIGILTNTNSGVTINDKLYLQLENGSTMTTFEPYGSKDKWCKYEAINKTVLNSSSYDGRGDLAEANTYRYYFKAPNALIVTSTTAVIPLYSNLGISLSRERAYNGDIGVSYFSQANKMQFVFDETKSLSINDLKTWLDNNYFEVYYILAVPTSKLITYQPLIEQLNLLEKAMSKDGQTNISQVNNDLPFIISASALKEWSV